MKPSIMPITILRHEGRSIWVPDDLLQTHQLTLGQTASVQFGQQKDTAKLLRSPHPRQLYVSHEVAQHLCLPPCPLHIRVAGQNQIRLGPVIGLLSSCRLPMFTSFLTAARNKGTVFYFFRPQDVNWSEKKVVATVLEPVDAKQRKVAWKAPHSRR